MNINEYTDICSECGAPAKRVEYALSNLATDDRIICSNQYCEFYEATRSENLRSERPSSPQPIEVSIQRKPACKTCDTALKEGTDKDGNREFYCPSQFCPRSFEAQKPI